MPRAKEYPGKLVTNTRCGNTKMHLLRKYRTCGKTVGIYSDAFDIFIKKLAKRIKDNQQNVVMVEGSTGAGKSTLAILMCYALAKRLKVPFDLEKDYIYSVEDLLKKIQDPNASPINLVDEAVLVVNAKRSQSSENIDIVNLFNTMRSLGWTTFLVGPSVYQIDKTLRQVHIDYLIHCSSNDDSPLRGFGRGFFEESKAKRSRFKKNAEPYWYLQMTGIFGKLPDKLDAKYQPIKYKAQMELSKRTARKHNVSMEEAEADA